MILRITYFTAIAAILSTIILVVLTHIPGSSIPDFARYNDKVLHYGAYAVVSLLYGISFGSKGLKGLLWMLLITLFLAALAAGDEYTQQYFSRTTDIKDYYADLRGIATGMGVAFVFWGLRTIMALKLNVTISK